jgi:hypothetical protein
VRFLDELINKGITLPPGTITVTADAVAKHLYEMMPKQLSLLDDFPNIAPPFEFMAVECLLPGDTNIPKHRVVWLSQNIEIGPDEDVVKLLRVGGMHERPALSVIERNPPRWISNIVAFDESCFGRASFGPLASALVCIRPAGGIMTYDNEKLAGVLTVHSDVMNAQQGMVFFYVYFMTLSFMNCKNVELHDVPNDPSFVRRFTKWNKRPPVQYKELNIVPMQKVIRRTAEEHKTGIHQAMHLCRGHFKDYRQRGLFGKYKGMFWWEQHVRGSENEGIIHKSYNVKPPPDTPKL